MADLGHGKDIKFVKDAVVGTGEFITYETHPNFTIDTQVVDKKYVDDQVSPENIWDETGNFIVPKNSPRSVLLEETGAYILADYVTDVSQLAFSSLTSTSFVWQSWTSTKDGYLGGIYFGGAVSGQINNISIYEGNGTGGTLVHSEAGYAFVGSVYTPSIPIKLSGTQQYTIARTYISGGGAGTINWSFSTANPYAGGQSSLNVAWDMIFEVYLYEGYTELDAAGIKSNTNIVIDANNDAADTTIDLTNTNASYKTDVSINGTGAIDEISTDGTFASATNRQISSALAVKTYVDNAGGGGITSAFTARLLAIDTNVTGDGTTYTITNWDQVYKDVGGDFNATTGKFTCPVDGWYAFHFTPVVAGILAAHNDVDIVMWSSDTVRGVNSERAVLVGDAGNIADIGSGGLLGSMGTFIEYFNVGSTVEARVRVTGSTKVVDVYPTTTFSGSLLVGSSGGSSPLQQLKSYYVSKAGSDTNSGKSAEDPFLTIGAANTAISGQSPSISNPFIVYIIDGIYTEDFTEQPYTHYFGPGVELNGEVVGTDGATLTIKKWAGKTSGGTNLFTKTAGVGDTQVRVIECINCNSYDGFLVTIGGVNIEVDRIIYGNADFISSGSATSFITVLCDHVAGSAVGNNSFANLTASNNLKVDVIANHIADPGTSGAFLSTVGAGVGVDINIRANRLITTRQAFNVGNLSTISANILSFGESVPSVVTGTGVLNLSIQSDITYSNKMRLQNTAGIDFKGTLESTDDIVIDAINSSQNSIVNITNSDATYDAILQVNGVAINPTGYLNQDQVYFVNKAGSNTNGGKSEEDPFLTIGKAILAINALTGGDIPSFNKPYEIKLIGGGEYIEDFTLPRFCAICGRGATLGGNATLTQDTHIAVKAWNNPTTGVQINAQLAGGGQPDGASIYIDDYLIAGINGAFKNNNTAGNGTLRINCGGKIFFFGGAGIIPNGAYGDYEIMAQEVLGDNINAMFNLVPSGGNTLNLYADINYVNNTDNNAGNFTIFGQGTVFAEFRCNRMYNQGGRTYNVQSGPVLDIICNDFKEAVASSISAADVNLQVTRADDDRLTLRNDTSGILIKSAGGNITTFEGPSTFPTSGTKIGVSEFRSHSQSFVNLSTTPVGLSFTFTMGATYLITIEGINTNTNTFWISADYNVNVPELVMSVFNANNGAVIQSPPGSFGITIQGLAGLLYILTINSVTGAATLEASTASTGTTGLKILALSNG